MKITNWQFRITDNLIYILGQGEDGLIYIWDKVEAKWKLFKEEMV